jgi:hypothetical protein
VAPPAPPAAAEIPTEGLPPGFGDGLSGRAAFGIALAFAVFQLWTAAYGLLPSQVVRAMHVGFLLLLGFALIANLRATGRAAKAWFWLLGALGFGTGLYNWVFYAELINRAGFPTTADLTVGTILIALVFEAARRLMGLPLAIISGVFLAYCFLGQRPDRSRHGARDRPGEPEPVRGPQFRGAMETLRLLSWRLPQLLQRSFRSRSSSLV